MPKKEETLNTLGFKIDYLTEICTTNFSRMYIRFDKIEERLDDHDEKFDHVYKGMDELKTIILSALKAPSLAPKRPARLSVIKRKV